MSDPTPPTDVRAVMVDGREFPLECVYRGFVNGTHLWAAVWTLPGLPHAITIGELPAHTSVSLECEQL